MKETGGPGLCEHRKSSSRQRRGPLSAAGMGKSQGRGTWHSRGGHAGHGQTSVGPAARIHETGHPQRLISFVQLASVMACRPEAPPNSPTFNQPQVGCRDDAVPSISSAVRGCSLLSMIKGRPRPCSPGCTARVRFILQSIARQHEAIQSCCRACVWCAARDKLPRGNASLAVLRWFNHAFVDPGLRSVFILFGRVRDGPLLAGYS